jgi:hypothetical protein
MNLFGGEGHPQVTGTAKYVTVSIALIPGEFGVVLADDAGLNDP